MPPADNLSTALPKVVGGHCSLYVPFAPLIFIYCYLFAKNEDNYLYIDTLIPFFTEYDKVISQAKRLWQ